MNDERKKNMASCSQYMDGTSRNGSMTTSNMAEYQDGWMMEQKTVE